MADETVGESNVIAFQRRAVKRGSQADENTERLVAIIKAELLGTQATAFEGSRVQIRCIKLGEVEMRLWKLRALAQTLEQVSQEGDAFHGAAWTMADLASEAIAVLDSVERA